MAECPKSPSGLHWFQDITTLGESVKREMCIWCSVEHQMQPDDEEEHWGTNDWLRAAIEQEDSELRTIERWLVMGLNRVSNSRKLRRLAAMVGEPVVRAYARYFTGHVLLVFGESGRQYAVDGDKVEPYTEDPPLRLVDHGIGTGAQH